VPKPAGSPRILPRSERRAFVLIALIVVAVVMARAPTVSAFPRRPDIIVILTDDERYRTLRWMPHLWKHIVTQGTRFPNAMVPTSLCCPSRASLLTGRFAHWTDVWTNTDGWRTFKAAGNEARTVAVWLSRAGYRTGLVGKYLNGFAGSHPPPGWTRWHSFVGENGSYYGFRILNTNGSIKFYGHSPSDYSTNVLRSYAVSYLRSSGARRPTFLYFAPFAPHSPATAAPEDVNLPTDLAPFSPPDFNEADVSDKPSWIQALPLVSASMVEAYRADQYRSLQAVDRAVQKIVNVQRVRGRLRNTLFIVMSDNGDMWGEHRVVGKFVPYAGATRVPLAMRWTRRLGPRQVDRRIALNVDVPVTIAAAARATTVRVEGRNLLTTWRRTGFVLEAAGAQAPGGNGTNVTRPPYCGWRTRRYLYVRYGNGRTELYDYRTDPWELTDRTKDPSLRGVKRRLGSKAMAACWPPPPGYRW
jgi:N-acetylglucosamine-6-sulfatase